MTLMLTFLTGKKIMRLLISWLIANLEIVSYIVATILIYMILEAFPHPEGLSKEYPHWVCAMVLAVGVLFLGAPTKSFLGDVLGIVFSIVGSMCTYVNYGLSVKSYVPCLVVSAGFGLMTAIYSWINFYDTVSLRWLYSNSDEAKFEATALYSFSRFSAGMNLALFAYTFIAILIAGK